MTLCFRINIETNHDEPSFLGRSHLKSALFVKIGTSHLILAKHAEPSGYKMREQSSSVFYLAQG